MDKATHRVAGPLVFYSPSLPNLSFQSLVPVISARKHLECVQTAGSDRVSQSLKPKPEALLMGLQACREMVWQVAHCAASVGDWHFQYTPDKGIS